MDEARAAAAKKAGLHDMDLLKLHAAEVPIDVALFDLKARFPTAFRQDVRAMPQAAYEASKATLLRDAQRQRLGRRA